MDRMKWGRWLFVTVFGFIALMEQSSLQAQERRIAIVIGNDAYEGGMRLSKAVNDAKLIAESLKVSGFDVTTLFDAQKNQIVNVLEKVTKSLGHTDAFLLYFAGHGVEIRGVNYLLPIDANSASAHALVASSISLQSLFAQAQQSAVQIWVFDACRDNPFVSKTRGLRPSVWGGNESSTYQLMTTTHFSTDTSLTSKALVRTASAQRGTSGSLTLYSSGADSCPSEDSNGTVTVFADSLARQIRLGGDVETATRIIRREVSERSGGQQVPQIVSSLTGDLSLKRP